MGTVTAPVEGSGSCPAWMASVSNSMSADNSGGANDRCQPRQRTVEGALVSHAPADPGLGVQRQQPQAAGGAVGLEVDPGGQPVAQHEGQHAVPVAPLVGALGDLD